MAYSLLVASKNHENRKYDNNYRLIILNLFALLLSSSISVSQTLPIVRVAYAEETVQTISIDGLIDRYAKEYKVSASSLRNTLKCESDFDIKAHNTSDPHGGAKGIAQFLQPTFETYSKRAGIDSGDPFNPEDAIHTMAYMFSIGEAKQWTCWRWIRDGKYPPNSP